MPHTSPRRPHHRAEALAALGDEPLDLLIVGGGITGAALAYVATQVTASGRAGGDRRLRVGLCEGADLASGTSSRSSRLLHGGLRYLAQGRLGLVNRLLTGRREIARLAPHLVAPAHFLLPLAPGSPHPPWMLRAALRLYGALEARRRCDAVPVRPHRLGAGEARAREPLLADADFGEALAYGELAVHDARLVVELAMAAAAAGARVATRARCQRLLWSAGRVVGAHIEDVLTGRVLVARARVVVNAAGPHGDTLLDGQVPPTRLHLSRGSHLVLPADRLPLSHTVIGFSPRDRRAVFASPRAGYVLVGTTEVEHRGPPVDPIPSGEEIRYLLEAVAGAFPAARLGPGDVVGSFAGLRPLARPAGTSSDPDDEGGSLDRGYAITWDAAGPLAMRGGKLTLALDGARRALGALHARRRALGLPALDIPRAGDLPPLPNAPSASPALAAADSERTVRALRACGVDAAHARRLVSGYGRGAEAIATLMREDPGNAASLRPGLPALVGELAYARRFEAAAGFDDFAHRRSDLHWLRAIAAWQRRHGTGARPPLDHAPGKAA